VRDCQVLSVSSHRRAGEVNKSPAVRLDLFKEPHRLEVPFDLLEGSCGVSLISGPHLALGGPSRNDVNAHIVALSLFHLPLSHRWSFADSNLESDLRRYLTTCFAVSSVQS
jgi:hypothetical protein